MAEQREQAISSTVTSHEPLPNADDAAALERYTDTGVEGWKVRGGLLFDTLHHYHYRRSRHRRFQLSRSLRTICAASQRMT